MDLDLRNIQGNIVPGFNKDYQAFLLVTFRSRDAGTKWLGELQPEVTSAQEVEGFKVTFKSLKERRASDPLHRDGGSLHAISATWLNVAVSFAGLQTLRPVGNLAPFPPTFRTNQVPGAKAPDARKSVHALLILAADHKPNLESELGRQRQRMAATGVDEVAIFTGATLPGNQRGHEHFGFKDAISQPAIAGTSYVNGPAVAAGEFILGLPDQTRQPSGTGLPAWTRNGSFVAFLQLQQHVAVFWNAMRQQAQQLGAKPEDVAAWIVGRKRDATGTPVQDPPARGSHIGRAFTRWVPPEESSRRRILRRGIPYGDPLMEGEPDDGQRGLLFVAYQADIERQFEYVWTTWLNSPSHPMPGAGRDALVGQMSGPGAVGPLSGAKSTSKWTPSALRPALASQAGQRGGNINLSLPVFVTPHYGGYFFAPAIDALSQLADVSPATSTTR